MQSHTFGSKCSGMVPATLKDLRLAFPVSRPTSEDRAEISLVAPCRNILPTGAIWQQRDAACASELSCGEEEGGGWVFSPFPRSCRLCGYTSFI